MYVYNPADGSSAWYPGPESNPSGGACDLGSYPPTILVTNANTQMAGFSMFALYGITACPASFSDALLLDLQTPTANGGLPEVKKFIDTADNGNLHEIMHLVSLGGRTCHSGRLPQLEVC